VAPAVRPPSVVGSAGARVGSAGGWDRYDASGTRFGRGTEVSTEPTSLACTT
jgi:hypothetical protein